MKPIHCLIKYGKPAKFYLRSSHSCSLTVHIGDPHELKDSNDDEGIGGGVCVHKLKHVNSTLEGREEKQPTSVGLDRGSRPFLTGEESWEHTGVKESPLPNAGPLCKLEALPCQQSSPSRDSEPTNRSSTESSLTSYS